MTSRRSNAQLGEVMGASQYPTVIAGNAELREHYADIMAAFMAVAIVDLSGLSDGDPFDRLAQAVNALAPCEGLFADRFRTALRAVTMAQLGEARAAHWHDLKLSKHAAGLYWHFRKDLMARHPELLAVGAGR
ncbi:MAG: hypothetical protein V2I27_09370 [Erythrobacter sp.]|jgi:hypothetical protein|nr:hypothetical protein [Erythrobacter sp.]